VIFREFERRVGRRLSDPLPGASAQKLLAPRPRRGWEPDYLPPDCRLAAGLLLFYPDAGSRPQLILTVRDPQLPHHGGQVSLPGGAVEVGETVAEAALREAHEEVGADPDRVRVLGELSPLHIPVSQFVLHPVVAVTDHRPELRPEAGEVARILEVPLDDLRDPVRVGIETRSDAGRSYEVPFIRIDGEKVWGATAMILAELLCLVDYRPAPWA
jgi:8-oxo-dGTP pyrophosphatase MutT (NUDIX family)